MIAFDVLLLTGAVALLCVAHWRAGVVATIATGFALDPLRKLVPGEPLYLSVLVFVLVVATIAGMRLRGVRLSLDRVFEWSGSLRVPLLLFGLLVVFQSVAAFLRTGSVPIAAIGLIAYLAPIPGVLIGVAYARRTADVRRLVTWYVVCVAIMAIGIYLSRAGYEWRLLDAVGVGLVAFTPTGERLELASGFFRTPEIAAWHLATATCFVVLLLLSRRKLTASLPPAALAALFFLVALLLTGRRKGVVEVAIFLLAYLLLISWFRRRAFRTALALSAGTLVVVALVWLTELGVSLNLAGYLERGTNIGATEAERYQRMGFLALRYVILRNGWLGGGAGTGSQGSQYFGGGTELAGRAAEGGFAKVAAELGVPGLVLLLVLVVAIGHHLWTVARAAGSWSLRRAHIAFAVLAIMFANAVMYAVAHQVFGDPLVLYVIGLTLGIGFAVPGMREGPRPRRGKRRSAATVGTGPAR